MMMFGVLALLILPCLSGLILFRRKGLPAVPRSLPSKQSLSVIIPARNEAVNLPHLLHSLHQQTLQPMEILVVDDHSEDETRDLAKKLGAKVVSSPDLPLGWTGKTWACWNGYLKAKGSDFLFLDADVRLAPNALEALVSKRSEQNGVLSVVPFHITFKLYERLALIPNILGVFAFTSPFESENPKKGLYGACILVTRKDYERIGGHQSIQSELLDDLNLGAKFQGAGLPVENVLGRNMVSFRMYPKGIRSELEGFAKGAVLSSATLHPLTLVFTGLWLTGLFLSSLFPFLLLTPYGLPLTLGYMLYSVQIYYFSKWTGQFGRVFPAFNILSTTFFIVVLIFSIYQVVFFKRVTWKGRTVQVGGKKM